jgi:non-ribosomal peptide synthase protein (TIGR01720 family)
LESVKRQLRTIPNQGIGYGVLKHLSPKQQIRRALTSLPEPEISFNYLGQFDQTLTNRSPFVVAEEPAGTYRSQRAKRTHLVEIIGSVLNGHLQVDWIYSANKHNAKTIERLANYFVEALSSVIDCCFAAKADADRHNQFGLNPQHTL